MLFHRPTLILVTLLFTSLSFSETQAPTRRLNAAPSTSPAATTAPATDAAKAATKAATSTPEATKTAAVKPAATPAASTAPVTPPKDDAIPETPKLTPIEKPTVSVMKWDKRRNRISITDDPKHTWARKDSVCVYRAGRALACGRVIAVGIRGAVVQLQPHSAQIKPGDEAIYFEPEKKIPELKDEDIDSVGLMDSEPYMYNVALGFIVGLDLRYPILHLYWAVAPKIAIGIQPAYISKTGDVTTATITGFGGVLTANYFSEEYFRGLWIQFGSGFYHLTHQNASTTVTFDTPTLQGTVGWREDWAHGLNVGAGLGVRWISPSPAASTITEVKYSSINALATVELGWSF